jgi:hypothetical protein
MLPNPFLSKSIHILFRGKKLPRNVGYFCNKKLPKVNNPPKGENSPNLVTLPLSQLVCHFVDVLFPIFSFFFSGCHTCHTRINLHEIVCFFFKKRGCPGWGTNPVLLISFIFSFSPLYR